MSRGRIDPPNLDDRTWRDIVEQAKALIPRYTPEWTDHNPSDLGIALIELFAWIAEGMIYRLNRVPEKNFIEFLNLLGITRDPATPASTFLTYSLAPGSKPLTIPKGHQVATPQTETEEAVIFETDQDLNVLPINLTTALLLKDNKYENITAALVDSPLTGKTLLIEQGKSITIALGFDKASTERIALLCHFSKPIQKESRQFTAVRSQAAISAATSNTVTVSAADAATFQVGDIVFLQQGSNSDRATITSISGTTITFTANLTKTYTSGATIRIADFIAGQGTIRLNSTAGIAANSTLRITQGTKTESVVVQSVANNIITLNQALTETYMMAPSAESVNLQTTAFFLDVAMSLSYSSATALPTAWTAIPSDNPSDGTDTFQKNGTVSFSVPAANWTSQNPPNWSTSITTDFPADQVNQPLFWIGIRLTNQRSQPLQLGLESILFNSVSATNALTVKEELLGVSNGQPFQFFELKNRPLFKRPKAQNPYDHLEIKVRELQDNGSFGDWSLWTLQDDFPQGEGKYFRLNPVTGTINFGNYHPTLSPDGHGSIPPAGSEIRATEYRYVVGGVKGNVLPKTITVIRTPIKNITEVKNLGYAKGGANEEAIEETKRRAPEVLRNRYRAITVEDYEYLAREASTKVKKVCCLPPREFTRYECDAQLRSPADPSKRANVGDPWNYGGLNRNPGTLNVIIIPNFQAPTTITSDELIKREPRPTPTNELIQDVKNYLDVRRPLTTNLYVTSPRYLPISVEVDIKIWKRVIDENILKPDDFKQENITKIQKFLHPLLGGPEEEGWGFGQQITVSELFKKLQPTADIGFISRLQIKTETPDYEPSDRPYQDEGNQLNAWVRVADYEIICSGTPNVKVDSLG